MANNTTTWRLDMSSAPGVWTIGPAFTPGRADFGLAYDAGTNKLYALGGDTTGWRFLRLDQPGRRAIGGELACWELGGFTT